jgi:hypothetical protein
MIARRCIAIMLCAALGVMGCGTASNRLVGSWRLVPEESDVPETAGQLNMPVKILNDTHFAFGFMTPDGGVYAGGGSYTYHDSTYAETIEYHSDPFLVGRVLEFKCILKGDTWYHTGSFDIEGRPYVINEVWQRMSEKK